MPGSTPVNSGIYKGVSKRVRHSCLQLKEFWLGARRFGAAYAEVECVWLQPISLRIIAILFFRAKKLVSVETVPTAPLRGGNTYPRKFMVSGFMEN